MVTQDAPFSFLYTLHGHHRDEQSFAHSAGQGCVICSDFPFHDDKSQRNKVKKFGFFTILRVSYDEGVPQMTVDSGRGWKTVSFVKDTDKHFQGPYVALSYQWGPKPLDNTLQLLNSTSAWLEKPNPINHPPKTLRDAVHVAYRFGVQYLWIDRLCIYQDSCEDWRKEAGTMQDVYRNALFCISALGAEDDESGCFFMRDPSLIAPSAVDIYRNGSAFRAELEETAWHAAFQHEPLIQRGWILQERLMAPRTIYFGSRQVFWECAESHACETHRKGFGRFSSACNSFGTEKHEKRDDIDYPLSKQLIAVPTVPCTTRDILTRILADWSSIVSFYSNTRLTLPRDKLVAVSGLAKDTRKALRHLKPGKHRYLAGLWEDYLIETLCWYVRVGTAATRATCYRALSWSWASLDGNLIIPDTFVEEVVEFSTIISDDIEFIGADDTGEVASGRLILRGPACSVDTQYFPSCREYSQ
ncbi:hypothetical protein Daesc_002558 [Daldinia eschscholtzii]|uniref:Heterokaryon incompatibility domain-containing protein n=1 Tax=Daldinia eschscholtzii TaxID=292717 RepID=A0AAX6MQM6_9PEZI